jgi:hypothetical protein
MRFALHIKARPIEWARLAAKSQFLEKKRPWVLRDRFKASEKGVEVRGVLRGLVLRVTFASAGRNKLRYSHCRIAAQFR